MAAGGFCKLPNGTVVVALNLPRPAADGPGEYASSCTPPTAPAP